MRLWMHEAEARFFPRRAQRPLGSVLCVSHLRGPLQGPTCVVRAPPSAGRGEGHVAVGGLTTAAPTSCLWE